MAFPQPNRKRNFSFVLVGVALLLLLFVVPKYFFRPVQMALVTLTTPFQSLFSWAAFEVRETGTFLSSINTLKEENESLHHEVLSLRATTASLAFLEEENGALREELDLQKKNNFTLVTAEVIARDGAASLWIDRGAQQGIQTGMPVIVHGKILVGRIYTITPFASEVRLLSHPESLIASLVEGAKTESIVRGDHGTGLLLDLARPNEQVKSGAAVMTAGMSDGLPSGLFIGTIDTPKLSGDQLFQQASILPPVRADILRFLSVILKY